MLNRPISFAALCALSLSSAPTLASDGWYLAPEAALLKFDSDRQLDNAMLLGLHLGYQTASNWAFELGYLQGDADIENLSNNSVDLDHLSLEGLYHFGDELKQWIPYVNLGIGNHSFDAPTGDSDETTINLGGGMSYHASEKLSMRTGLKLMHSVDESDLDYGLFASLNYFFGAKAAPLPPVDADNDGVNDNIDKCLNTTSGAPVNTDGCEVDSDNDGIVDRLDQCAGTASGSSVDSNGCPVDSDGDGIADGVDQCADTKSGAKVDASGCYIVVKEAVTVELNVQFDNNSAQARPDHKAEVEKVSSFMREYPLTNVVIEGHTDSLGKESYNIQLSQRRANTIADMLINEFGIEANRVSAKGFGPSKPIASNTTREGRKQNRRVVAVVNAVKEDVK